MIKLVDLNQLHEALRADLEGAFRSVVDRGRFILGEEVRKLEADFAAYQGCRHGVGASSGTDALLLALKASGVGPDDEVIVPSMTFCATAEAVCHLGARPVFVDVEAETLGIDPAKVEAAINARTKAILPVHLHGWPVPLGPLSALAERSGLAIIEDCAQRTGAARRASRSGAAAMPAASPSSRARTSAALGDAGMVVTNDSSLADRMRALADHGRRSKFSHDEVGYDARLDELQAAFLNVKLRHLEGWNEREAPGSPPATPRPSPVFRSSCPHPQAPTASRPSISTWCIARVVRSGTSCGNSWGNRESRPGSTTPCRSTSSAHSSTSATGRAISRSRSVRRPACCRCRSTRACGPKSSRRSSMPSGTTSRAA